MIASALMSDFKFYTPNMTDIVHALDSYYLRDEKVSGAYRKWFPALDPNEKSFNISKNVSYIGVISLWSGMLAFLENNRSYKERALHLGVVSRIADELLEDGAISMDDFTYFVIKPSDEINSDVSLLNMSKRHLAATLPVSFRQEHIEIISRFNESQAHTLGLHDNITLEDLTKIKNDCGGYSLLLAFAIVNDRMPLDLDKNYSYTPENIRTKEDFIYTLGAWGQRLDDLCDVEEDTSSGKKSLAKHFTWHDLDVDLGKIMSIVERIYSIEKKEFLHTIIERFMGVSRFSQSMKE